MSHFRMDSNQRWKHYFFIMIAGQSISVIGSTAVQFSVIWWLTIRSGSSCALALAALAAYIPQILLGPFVSVWLDRWNRKKVVIIADLFTGSISAIFAVFFAEKSPSNYLTCVLLCLRAIGSVFHSPALQAIIPDVVPQNQLTKANSWHQFFQAGAMMLGPVLGSILYAAFPLAIILMTDLLGALVASATLLPIEIPSSESPKKHSFTFWTEFKEGTSLCLKNRQRFLLTVCVVICMVFFMPFTAFYPLMTSDYFCGTAYQASYVEILYSLGMMIGAFLINRFAVKLHRHMVQAVFAGLLGIGITSLLSGVLPDTNFAFGIFVLLCFLMGMSAMMYDIPFTTYLQKTIPAKMQGRAFSLIGASLSLTMPIGLLIAGPIAECTGIQIWFRISGIIIVFVVLLSDVTIKIYNSESGVG